MGFRIVAKPRAWWPVTWTGVAEDGELVENRIEMRFFVLKVDEAKSFLVGGFAAAAAEQAEGVDLPQLYAEQIAVIADDWRGVEAENGEPLKWDVPAGWRDAIDDEGKRKPLSAPNLKLLMNEGGLFTHIFEAWRDLCNAQPKVREGN